MVFVNIGLTTDAKKTTLELEKNSDKRSICFLLNKTFLIKLSYHHSKYLSTAYNLQNHAIRLLEKDSIDNRY